MAVTTSRDVKSLNILLTNEGVAKLGDVGIAFVAGRSSSTGTMYGTFNYAAPEMLMGMDCTPKVNFLIP